MAKIMLTSLLRQAADRIRLQLGKKNLPSEI
jgi:hypothetical protein